MRRGFTLTELLIVMAILGIMAALTLAALSGATELAREQRTRAIIAKLDSLIAEQYEGYRTRAVPLRIPPRLGPLDGSGQPTQTDGRTASTIRLYALRDLMRMEMPERVTDVSDGPAIVLQRGAPWNVAVQMPQSSAHKRYRRLALRLAGTNWASAWTEQHQGSECLYLIVSGMTDGDKQALDFFAPEEVGDTDGDGMKEILDGWGRPIEFLRWAPGYTLENGVETSQTANATLAPDPFDPAKVDPRWTGAMPPYALRPLIFSAGRDSQFDIAAKLVDSSGNQFRFVTVQNDPYYTPTAAGQFQSGTPVDFDGDGVSTDNLTNHWQSP
jgi:prepilin-type N-terminal cleavage/methylation domain-containing protein